MTAEMTDELLTAAQMRAIEEAAMATGEVTGLELMERAGRGVVTEIFKEWPALAPSWGPAPKPPEFSGQDEAAGHRAVVLCGPGNNGGDGFVVARLLKGCGWDVEVFFDGDPAKLPPDAQVNYRRWREMGEVSAEVPVAGGSLTGGSCDLVVDAVFGTGLSRPFEGPFSTVAQAGPALGAAGVHRVAIDVPSGLCADSGRILGTVITADLTVGFHAAKQGVFLAAGPKSTGRVVVVDIGLGTDAAAGPAERVTRLAGVGGGLSKADGHKYAHGHALILSGGVGKGGAARLSARGALRIGAGAVTLGCPPAALIENAARLDAVMLTAIRDAAALVEVLEDTRINALCLGPGMGVSERSQTLISAALGSGRAVVLDADALTLLARDAGLFGRLHEACVLTPHAGEFARLFPDIAEKLDAPVTRGPAFSKVDATRAAAARAGCVVLFKGPDTVIADPSGRCSINASVHDRAAPWLATAGSGDVLAGFVTGLLARGRAPLQAAETGAWLHTECALSFGPGLVAEDLAEELPEVLRSLGV